MKIIFDVDGTLMDIETRRKWLEGPTPNWTKFMDPKEMETDTPNQHVMEVAECMHDAGHEIVIVSARNERHREVTEHQLKQNFGVFWSHMFLRPDDSFEPDNQFKQRVLDELIKADWKPDMVFDDRDQVVEMWRANGIQCFQVAKGDF
jgi:phosphoglycolate phosphatase-like HAD superfamily hydrolase|tara:strand:- start:501 stop:944 length:444 start_codon:yes stop_codon:yes gene_type:complete